MSGTPVRRSRAAGVPGWAGRVDQHTTTRRHANDRYDNSVARVQYSAHRGILLSSTARAPWRAEQLKYSRATSSVRGATTHQTLSELPSPSGRSSTCQAAPFEHTHPVLGLKQCLQRPST